MNIASTSALVLLWADGAVHSSHTAKKFLHALDLQSGKELLEKCNRFWPHYYTVIQNRKSCILELAKNTVLQNKVKQIIILGAGYDALSLEICSWSKSCKVFEIDAANMETKNTLIRSVDSSLADQIKCIALDIGKPNQITKSLGKHGWDKEMPSLIVIEGLSYYTSKSNLYDIVDKFKTTNQSNHIILEYLLPHDSIPKKWQAISQYPFDLIAKYCNLDYITRYDVYEITTHLKEMGGIISQHYTSSEMAKNQTLQNSIFGSGNNGWIEICKILI